MLRESCPANQAHLRSHSGAGSSQVLVGCPTKPEFRIAPDLFRTLILERLRLPLLVCEARCECGLLVDGHGRLCSRASAPERALARVSREAGASVRFNAKLVDMNIAVPADDARAVCSRQVYHSSAGLTCCGHHVPECSDSDRIASSRRCSGGRHRVHGGQG